MLKPAVGTSKINSVQWQSHNVAAISWRPAPKSCAVSNLRILLQKRAMRKCESRSQHKSVWTKLLRAAPRILETISPWRTRPFYILWAADHCATNLQHHLLHTTDPTIWHTTYAISPCLSKLLLPYMASVVSPWCVHLTAPPGDGRPNRWQNRPQPTFSLSNGTVEELQFLINNLH